MPILRKVFPYFFTLANYELTTKTLGATVVKIDRQFAIFKFTFLTYSYSLQVAFTNGFVADISIMPVQTKVEINVFHFISSLLTAICFR